MKLPIPDRETAGRELAQALESYRDRDHLVVLALPRGGLPVAAEIARHLGGKLDLMTVRKLGMPGHKELAMGAIASGGTRVLNEEMLRSGLITESTLEEVTEVEQRELERRERLYRGSHPWPELAGATVILVDDGLATGATMRAALEGLKPYKPRETVVAVPVAPEEPLTELRKYADEVVCLETPPDFRGIGQWYKSFEQVEDEEVEEILGEFWGRGG